MRYFGRNLLSEDVTICSRCIYDSSLFGITFDHEGVCSYCRMVEKLADQYKTGKIEGQKKFESIVSNIKKAGRGKQYDVAVGFVAEQIPPYALPCWEYGLRPLAVHYDNTFNSAIATENIRRITSLLVSTYIRM